MIIIIMTILCAESDEEITISTLKPTSIVVNSPAEQPSFTCIANAPNITMSWTFINSEGEETSLIDHEDGAKYRIIMNDGPNGNSTTKSTLTLLELPTNSSAIVRCKISSSFGIIATKLDGFFIISKS
ncbi:MAG: hypothetical protein MJE68_18775 [Proteobacteria bacterium]|nr:hypothetical protein [Pseudomonadota bacterium]